MMIPKLREELEVVLEANNGRLGSVFRLIKGRIASDNAIVEAGGAASNGAVSNLYATIRAIIEERIPIGFGTGFDEPVVSLMGSLGRHHEPVGRLTDGVARRGCFARVLASL
jgi:hypothetical protein